MSQAPSSPDEFDIIRRYFSVEGLAANPLRHPQVRLGIGDDCALLALPAESELALSMDVLNETVHFPADAPPFLLAQRALAVNLSDLAAMGAEPLGFTLGLSLPRAEPDWLAAFAQGLGESARRYHCPLLGGDMTRLPPGAPLSLVIQVQGMVPTGQALTRWGAEPGDKVYVSGTLGAAAAGLAFVTGRYDGLAREEAEALTQAFYCPVPRLSLGQALRPLASAAIDISDGLLADLGHIARASEVAIQLHAECIPVSPLARRVFGEAALSQALSGGDDYELAFVLPAEHSSALPVLAESLGLALTEVGEVREGSGVDCLDAQGMSMALTHTGYRHF